MLTLFLVFIIIKGALTLYEGNTIGGRAIRVGDTAQYWTTGLPGLRQRSLIIIYYKIECIYTEVPSIHSNVLKKHMIK